MSFAVSYADLATEASAISEELSAAFERVIRSGRYILGPELAAFEAEFASYCGTRFAAGTSSGTAALVIALRSLGLPDNAEVITVSNSFVATSAAIVLAGAKPVFVDIREDGNIDPERIERAITPRTRAIVPVHLTGRPARMDEINSVAKRHGLFVIADAAQAVGARWNGKRVGALGHAACFSFNPLKNLHAIGDGGAVVTDDEALYQRLLSARSHGLVDRERCEFFSFNCRLDELQAALLRVQLPHLETWTEARRRVAFRYNDLLSPYGDVPREVDGESCVYQTYVLKVEQRDALQRHLRAQRVEALVHYATPIHAQPAARFLKCEGKNLPVTLSHVNRILSLPIYPNLTMSQQDAVIASVSDFFESH